MKLQRVEFRNLAGYSYVVWNGLQRDLNLLIGRNGAGKSTILQALSAALHQAKGVRREGLMTSSEENASVSISLTNGEELSFPLHEILRRRVKAPDRRHLHVIHWAENRQPKNQIGTGESNILQHSVYRYPHTVSKLKEMLKGDAKERSVASEIFAVAKTIHGLGDEVQWRWIEKEIVRRGPKRARPMSCGQFEVLALAKDLVELRHSHDAQPGPVFVVIDNPETFLHPASQDDVLGLIRQLLPDAQIFIATHSLKLLSRRDARSIYWLRREGIDDNGGVQVRCIRDLDDGARGAFFELYGDDVSGSVLQLLGTLESPEYYKFLYDCAFPSEAVTRANPGTDRQLAELSTEVSAERPLVVMDVGAGHGDFVEALRQRGRGGTEIRYIAVSNEPSPLLMSRVESGRVAGTLAQESRVVETLVGLEEKADLVVLCNVCHEIEPGALSELLALLVLSHVSPGGRIVIAEVETLTAGEADFVMWTPRDYEALFRGIAGVTITTRQASEKERVPLDSTAISMAADAVPPGDLETQLKERFIAYLPKKREELLEEVDRLREVRRSGKDVIRRSFSEAVRQRRLAFVVSQIATVCRILRDWERRPLEQSFESQT